MLRRAQDDRPFDRLRVNGERVLAAAIPDRTGSISPFGLSLSKPSCRWALRQAQGERRGGCSGRASTRRSTPPPVRAEPVEASPPGPFDRLRVSGGEVPAAAIPDRTALISPVRAELVEASCHGALRQAHQGERWCEAPVLRKSD